MIKFQMETDLWFVGVVTILDLVKGEQLPIINYDHQNEINYQFSCQNMKDPPPTVDHTVYQKKAETK